MDKKVAKKVKSINMYFGRIKSVLLYVVLVGAAVLFALDVSMLVRFKESTIVIGASTSLAASLVIAAATIIILAHSKYAFYDDFLAVIVGFFRDKIKYDCVRLLRQNAVSGELYMTVEADTGLVTIKINVKNGEQEAFVSELAKHISDMQVEMFTLPPKADKK